MNMDSMIDRALDLLQDDSNDPRDVLKIFATTVARSNAGAAGCPGCGEPGVICVNCYAQRTIGGALLKFLMGVGKSFKQQQKQQRRHRPGSGRSAQEEHADVAADDAFLHGRLNHKRRPAGIPPPPPGPQNF